MATVLTFGLQLPEDGDKGATVFNALEANIIQLDAHDHDGVDSDNIDGFDLRRGSVAVDATGWAASGDLFKKTVTIPVGYSVANASEITKASIKFYFDGGTYDKQELFPKYERISDTDFELYSINSTQAFTVTLV